MASRRPTMMDPPIEALLDKVDSRFALVTVSARRARQINSYFNQLGEGLGAIVPPQVASVSRKPLSIALEEIVSEKITFTAVPDDEEGVAGESVVPEAVLGEPSTEGPH
ncbi:MAG: DNA-directed RNA polymerase subunit omega [Actinomycetota bacterium]|nr:DNA-directed RNA polymerase subunit omega [Actinomycetota bacterium]MDQ3680038.1 DNA-directed RNA polymerase subunit omega [Actinomycetota bacterium]